MTTPTIAGTMVSPTTSGAVAWVTEPRWRAVEYDSRATTAATARA